VPKTFPVQHIATLSNLPVTDDQAKRLEQAFEETLAVVADLQTVDVTGVEPTFQVTGLENVLREDVVNEQKMFTQEQALANAKKTFDGFFVVPQVISQD
jgi:aspartyl-tRNA(Asn)/glutamyl-tRNA(Gln) amidotransferase subunit C